MSLRFSIVVPVYNEADFIPEALPRLVAAMDGLATQYRILLVENGSTDGTAEIAGTLAPPEKVTVESLPAADYGAAMRHGFLRAEGDWVVNFDIDYFSAEFIRTVMDQDGADLVIGSKRDPGSEDNRPLIRRLATRVFNVLLRTILGSHVSDTHGMKAFKKDLVEAIVPHVHSTQDLFDTELVVRAERAGYKITEVPVVVEELRTARSSLVRRVPRTLSGLWRIRRLLAEDGV